MGREGERIGQVEAEAGGADVDGLDGVDDVLVEADVVAGGETAGIPFGAWFADRMREELDLRQRVDTMDGAADKAAELANA